MTAPIVCTVTYTDIQVEDQITTSPWSLVGAIFPERGSVPNKPQFHLDILQPPNVDGARYRIGGAHFPQFKLMGIVATGAYSQAVTMARDMELTKGGTVSIQFDAAGLMTVNDGNSSSGLTCMVIDVSAQASAKRVLGAEFTMTAGGPPEGDNGGESLTGEAKASVDVVFTLQYMAS